MSEHLKGLRVVELGTHVAVPKVARMMADWGADVIKVEPPKGEAWRTMGPAYEMPVAPGNNPIFEVENINKRSVALNLKTAEGIAAMKDLLKTADVFVTNTRMKGLEKLGLGYEDMKALNPGLIYAHFGAYGPKGPEKDSPGFDLASFWGKSGALLEWVTQDEQPFCPKPGLADSTCGAILLSGIMTALYKRTQTGEGELVQSSLYAGALWCNSLGLVRGQPRYGLEFPRAIQADPLVPPYQSKDGKWIVVAHPQWGVLYPQVFKLIGLEDRIGDPMLHERSAAQANYHKVRALIAEAYSQRTAEELMGAFKANDIVCVQLSSPNDMYCDEQAWANDYLTHITLENGDDLVVPNTPIQFGEQAPAPQKLAPALGADTAEIFASLGYDEAKIAALVNK